MSLRGVQTRLIRNDRTIIHFRFVMEGKNVVARPRVYSDLEVRCYPSWLLLSFDYHRWYGRSIAAKGWRLLNKYYEITASCLQLRRFRFGGGIL